MSAQTKGSYRASIFKRFIYESRLTDNPAREAPKNTFLVKKPKNAAIRRQGSQLRSSKRGWAAMVLIVDKNLPGWRAAEENAIAAEDSSRAAITWCHFNVVLNL
jgi:hypothetical protein